TAVIKTATGRGDTHQACPLLKVNRPCHLAAVTSQFDPQPTWGKLKSRIATALCYPLRREAREEQGGASSSHCLPARQRRGRSTPNVPVWPNTFFPPNPSTANRPYRFGQVIKEAIESWPSEKRVAVFAAGWTGPFLLDARFA